MFRVRRFLAWLLGLTLLAGAGSALAQAKLDKPHLDQLLAPVALYPDALLSQVLMAATYPADVAAAAQWSKPNPSLSGDAAQLVSTPGKTNGLYWPSASAENDSPLGPDALVMGPETPSDEAFFGYRFRVIAPPKGSDAKYAFIAWPAHYGESGVHAFLLDSDRRFYERDFGKDTAARAGAMRTYSTAGWTRVADR